PSFTSLKDDDINAIIAFLYTHNSSKWKPLEGGKGIPDPLPEKIKKSTLVVNLVQIARFPPTSDTNNLPLTRITKLDYEPGNGQLFVNDLRGKLYKLQDGIPSLYLDIAKLRPMFLQKPGLATGFGSFAFHP